MHYDNQDQRAYEGLQLSGIPACPYCGENLSLPRPEPEWCPSCGAEIPEDHPSRHPDRLQDRRGATT